MDQVEINQLSPNEALETLKSMAKEHFAPYPQYDGYYDDAFLARMQKNWYKYGVYYFRKGDLVVVRKSKHQSLRDGKWEDSWTAYYPETGSNLILWEDHFKRLFWTSGT